MKYNTDKLSNVLPRKANPSYTFACLDAARETKHRIRLYINEWDVNSEFLKYMNAATRASATPDASASATCDITNDWCDDYSAWNYYQAEEPTAFPGHDFGTN